MRIAILGSGPSGLVAAHAAQAYLGMDGDIAIFSEMKKSPIFGAQYLHQPIPGVSTDEPAVIRYRMSGTPQSYLDKVYGDLWDGHVSDDLRDQAHTAWDLRLAYDKLWSYFEPYMSHLVLVDNTRVNAENIHTLLDAFDMVVNTIPRKTFCLRKREHRFKFTEIWAMGDSDARQVPYSTEEGIIHYNGEEDMSWYRAARVFGYSTIEWPHRISKPPITGIARVRKPINHDCNCIPEVKHLGRMGRYDKNKLVHHAYADMTELLMIATEGK